MPEISAQVTGVDSRKVLKTTGDEICSTVDKKETAGKLPEELVEKIISRIPFPSLFKAIVLSRPWYFKFPLASQQPRSLSLSFQNHVNSVSCKWATYCPVLLVEEICPDLDAKNTIVGFDQATSKWKYLMDNIRLPIEEWSFSACAGPFLCVAKVTPWSNDEGFWLHVLVMNTLTRNGKTLPIFGGAVSYPNQMKFIMTGANEYKVLAIFWKEGRVFSEVYDSVTAEQRISDMKDIQCRPNHCVSAYLNGKLYFMCDDVWTKKMRLWIHDYQKDVWDSIPESNVFENVADCGVLLCGNKVMVAACFLAGDYILDINDHDYHKLCTPKESIHIYEIDILTLELNLVDTGPCKHVFGVGLSKLRINFSSDADCIYFGHSGPDIPVLAYNVQSREWDCLAPPRYASCTTGTKRWMDGAFQPGLSPFMRP